MKKKSTLQNIFYNSFGTMFYYGCQWLTTIIIVSLGDFTDVGNYSLAMTFTAAFAIFALFNTRQYQVSDIRGEYTDKTYIASRFIAITVAFLVCAAALLLNDYTAYQWAVILWYMGFKCVESLIDVYHGIDQKNGRMDYICYSYLVRGVLMLLSFCGIIYLTQNLVYGVAGMAATSLLVAFLYDYPISRQFIAGDFGVSKSALRSLMMLMIPLVIVAVTNNLSISLPKYFLERFYDETILGYYSSVATPTMILQVGASTIFIPLITPLADRLAANDKAGFIAILKKVSLVLAGLSALALIVSALLGRWFLTLVFYSKIQEIEPYIYLFVPIIVTTLLISINACLFPVCTVLREIKGQLFVGIGGIITSCISSMFLVKEYSMNGVVISLIITLCVQILIEIYCVYHKMKKWKGTENG